MNPLKAITSPMGKKRQQNGSPEDFADILGQVLKHLDERFDHVDQTFQEVFKRLDRIEFLVSGQERRITTLEDRMRIVATKLGLEFRAKA
jgi:hypothetical protein